MFLLTRFRSLSASLGVTFFFIPFIRLIFRKRLTFQGSTRRLLWSRLGGLLGFTLRLSFGGLLLLSGSHIHARVILACHSDGG
ncbi:hypothetical protein F5Y06DRAFT_258832 [Hypoxylon sp. FL0890]|nr:hypothetical protein F5Y06DRAFT_258832 [Hypoxylon sp. FL0890]